MQRDYKVLPPEATDPEAAEEFWDKAPPMSDMPVNSIIGSPQSGGTIKSVDGYVEVRGYALPGGMQGPVVSVQVSSDDGETWVESELDFGEYHQDDRLKIKWAWCLWKARVKIPKGTGGNIVSKATDFGGNVQPKDMEWNLRGVGYSAWGLVDNLNVIEDRWSGKSHWVFRAWGMLVYRDGNLGSLFFHETTIMDSVYKDTRQAQNFDLDLNS